MSVLFVILCLQLCFANIDKEMEIFV